MAGAVSQLQWLDLAAPAPAVAIDPQHEADVAIARAEGFDAGYAAARAEADAAHAAATRAIETALRDSGAQIDRLIAELSAEAANLALAIGDHLAGHTRDTDAALAKLIGDAVRQAVGQPVLRLTVAPERVEAVRTLASAAVDRIGAGIRVDVEGEAGLQPGDIRADWQTGGLQASAEERRSAILTSLASAGL